MNEFFHKKDIKLSPYPPDYVPENAKPFSIYEEPDAEGEPAILIKGFEFEGAIYIQEILQVNDGDRK